jgi:bacteriorhodopsin
MQAVLVLHNITRWAVLLFGVWALLNAITGISGKRAFSANDKRSGLLFMTFCDIQLVMGLILYFTNNWFGYLKDMGNTMKDTRLRFFAVEHIAMMIIAWLLVHIGYSAVKRADTDAKKHKKMLIFFGLALLLILASIPWPFREAIAKPLFRWFN